MEFLRPATLAEASTLLADDPWGSKLIAGGTALVLMMKHRLVAPERLVSIADIPDLTGVDVSDEHLTIRGATTITDAARHDLLRAEFPGLATALDAVGNVRIRNAATVAGNVAEADYASDPPAVLVALGAEAVVHGPDGVRYVPVGELITGFYSTTLEAGDIITGVRIPRVAGRRSTYLKYRSRSTEDRPCVGVAAAVTPGADGRIGGVEIVVGAAGPRPQRFPEVTDALAGATASPALVAEVAGAYGERVEAMDDQRGSSWYRKRMVEVHVRRALTSLLGEEAA